LNIFWKLKIFLSLMKSAKHARLAIFFAIFICAINQSFIFSSLTTAGREIGMSDFTIGFICGAPAIAYILFAPILAPYIVVIGVMNCVAIGLFTSAICGIFCGLILDVGLQGVVGTVDVAIGIFFLRLLQNSGWALLFPATQIHTINSSQTSAKVAGLAFFAMAHSLGIIAGPILSWYFAASPYPIVFYAAGFSNIIALVVCIPAFFSKELIQKLPVKRKIEPLAIFTIVGNNFKSPIFALLVISILSLMGLTSLQTTLALVLQDFGHMESGNVAERAGKLLSTMALGALIAQCTLSFIRIETSLAQLLRWLLRIAAFLLCILMITISYNLELGGLLVCFLLGASFGAVGPLVISNLSKVTNESELAKVVGVLASAQGIGRLLGPIYGVAILSYGLEVFTLLFCIVLIFASVLVPRS
jgi:MFS family permease